MSGALLIPDCQSSVREEIMKKSRRDILKMSAMAGAGMLIPPLSQRQRPTPSELAQGRQYHGHVAHHLGVQPQSPLLTPFIDPLPIPPVIRPKTGSTTNINMTTFKQKLHHDLPPTPLWGYNGIYPGPTFEVRTGSPIKVKYSNSLPTTHFLPVDTTIHGSEANQPQVRTIVHLHGLRVAPDSDGYPEAWFTSDGKTGPVLFNPNPFFYPNEQQATNLWYHDHAIGSTRLNIYTGLAGFYFIRDSVEDSLNIPRGQFEVPLMIQDRIFNADGSLEYPVAVGGTHQFWIPEFFGDTALVNGMVFPHLDVEPRRYRFRMLNACNARFLHMTLVETDGSGNPMGMAGPMFNIIGTDGGLRPSPVASNDLLHAPAERFDVIIDFTGLNGKFFVLTNDAPDPFPGGGEVALPQIMMFRVVKALSSADTTEIPQTLNPVPQNIDPATAVNTRNLVLSEADRASDGFPIIGQLDNKLWDDPVTENPQIHSTEIWQLINTTGDAHPKHIHLVQFQILNRQAFDQKFFATTGKLKFTAPPTPPAPEEVNAYKDVIKAFPGTVTRLIMKFDPPTSLQVKSGDHLKYVWHCHILEHEDNEMMRPYDVVVP